MSHRNNSYSNASTTSSSSDCPPRQIRQLELPQPSTADGPDNESPGEGHHGLHPSAVNTRAIASVPGALDSNLFDLADASSSHALVENQDFPSEYPSADLEPGPNEYPNSGSHTMSDNNLAFPWTRPQDARPTSINGGTFIGGNVTNIQRHGEDGES